MILKTINWQPLSSLALDLCFIAGFHTPNTLCPSHRQPLVDPNKPRSTFHLLPPPHHAMPIHQFPSPPLPGSKPKVGTPNGRGAAHASTAQPNGHSKVSALHSPHVPPTARSSDTTGSPLSSLASSITRGQTTGSDDDDGFDDLDERTAVGPSSEGAGGMRRSGSGGVSLQGSEMDVDEPEESDRDSEEEDSDNDNDNDNDGRVVVHGE